jgi:GTP-binding protein
MQPFSHAAFLRAAGRPQDFLAPGRPEIAFAGRSNVGKSSAINALCARRALARTSKTPGRTQTINFYDLAEQALLADLPGYGYARVPQALRNQWAALVEAYLKERASVVGVVLVMDARRPLTPLDRQLLAWLAGFRVLALLSKCDKLGRVEQAKTLTAAKAALAGRAGETTVALFSSVSLQGVEEARGLLEGWLLEAASPASKRRK